MDETTEQRRLRNGKRGKRNPFYRFHVPSYIFEDDPEVVIAPNTLWLGLVKDTTAHGLLNLAKSRGNREANRVYQLNDFVAYQA